IRLNQVQRLVAIGLVNPHRAGRADAVRLQEDHDGAHRLVLMPALADALHAARTDALDLMQEGRALINHRQGARTEHADDAFGKLWADALDEPGTEILLNPIGG